MTDLTSSRYGPASTDSTQWESCPSPIQHTLMDTVSSMNMNECNIYNILIPSSSTSSSTSSLSSSMFIYISIIQYNQSSSSLKNIHVSTSIIIINNKNTHVSTSFQDKSIDII